MEHGPEGYGFAINGERPVFVRSVVPDGPADVSGLREGDIILKVNTVACPLGPRSRVVDLIKVRRRGKERQGLLQMRARDALLKRSARCHCFSQNAPRGELLQLIVCRTPPMERRQLSPKGDRDIAAEEVGAAGDRRHSGVPRTIQEESAIELSEAHQGKHAVKKHMRRGEG